MLPLILAAFGCLILAAPIAQSDPSLNCPTENLPWTISNIVVFTSNLTDMTTGKEMSGMGMDPNDTTVFHESFIDFHFHDSNKGLELKVECSRFTNSTLLDDENFYQCDKRGVVFKYGGRTLEVQRAFTSPCLGEYPYDSAIAFGEADMNLTGTAAPEGTLATQALMEMPISSLT